MLFSTQPESPQSLPLSAAVAEDAKLPNMSLFFASDTLGRKTTWWTSKDTSLMIHGYLGLQKYYKKSPNG
jgi:hypothetical protein